MARFGIGYEEIAEAAEQLRAQGINPTVESIRRKTGTGSNGTIAMHLRAWRERQDETKRVALKENLPEELVSTLKGLWSRVVSEAQEKIETIKQGVVGEVLEIKTRSEKLAADSARWEQQFHTLKHEKDTISNDKLSLEQVLIELKKQNALLESKSDALTQQIKDKQAHIDELNRLHKQVQINLEHYQESAREQRLIEQQRFEQQQHQMSQTINQLEQKLVAHRHDCTILNEKLHQTNHEKESIQKSNDGLHGQLEKIQIHFSQIEKEYAEKTHAVNQLQITTQTLQEKLNEHIATNNQSEKQIAVLTQQLSMTQNEANELSTQNKSLAHEKWILGQEKAQLEGRLKQMGILLEKQTAAS